MYFESFADFLAMGNHGFYVWLSYGTSLALIALGLWTAWRAGKQAEAHVQRLLRREEVKS